ncbi:hypothetical protein [Taibaiella soli]|uniref:Uncharacterized protein n=1 Tax=Taibaiella soli TaxID=1649169 RepID=A0A2W2B8H6_9BACT|nr:hypothetical protein [Taibaiella soli]PZF72589.1 hypothetical protein DN068_12040 [Taibaiella soli]
MNYLRKKTLLALGLLSVASLTACTKKHDSGTNVKPKTSTARSVENDDQTLADIQTFYQNVKNIRDGNDPGSTLISADDAEFLTEASYNYYVARNDYKYATTSVDFSITEPMSSEGIQMKDVTDAFWQIKANLMTTYNQINFDEKGLALFDLKLTVIDDRTISFDVYATIKSGPEPTIPSSVINNVYTVSGAPNHAWNAISSSDIASTAAAPGQYNIDITNKSLISGSQTYGQNGPGAAEVLRKLGINNYWQGNQPAIAYGQLITYIQYKDLPSMSTTAVASPISDYVASNIPGYVNRDRWVCTKFYSIPGTYLISDADQVFKEWLTTPNMNYYLSFIPGLISNGKNALVMPPNSGLTTNSYVFCDLKIYALYPVSGGAQPANTNIYNQPWLTFWHAYKMTYGVITGIKLPPPGSLATF